jgi:hypothetical protein
VERPDGKLLLFTVTDVRVVDSRRTRLALDGDEPRLTLVTCYPFDAIRPGGPLRFVVTADWAVKEGPMATAKAAKFAAGEMGVRVGGLTPPRELRAAALPRPVPLLGPLPGL